MQEFIVWDEERECFIDETKCVFVNGTLYRNEKDFANVISDDLTMFPYIGIWDSRDRKIYAECSIVEFEYDNLNGTFTHVKGYLYIKDWQYRLKILWSDVPQGVSDLPMAYQKTHNLKIIDTIQENKLGLIK